MQKLWFAILLIVATSCAIIREPTGGEKDTTPPQLLSTSLADSSLNTKPEKLIFTFDELVDASQLAAELIISPETNKKPIVSFSKRSVKIDFKDILFDDNTTYILNFGNGIKDVNEGNTLTDYTFRFSTGSYLDSFSISGKVISPNNEEFDLKKTKILLYKNVSDTIVFKSKPNYFTGILPNGYFELNNLPKGEYAIYALEDENSSLIMENKEPLGFLPNSIKLNSKNPKEKINQLVLTHFTDSIPKITSYSQNNNRIYIGFTRWIDSLTVKNATIENLNNDSFLANYQSKDTIIFVKAFFGNKSVDTSIAIQPIDSIFEKPYLSYVDDDFLRWHLDEEIIFKSKDDFSINNPNAYLFLIDSVESKLNLKKSKINDEYYLALVHTHKENVRYDVKLYPELLNFNDSTSIDTLSVYKQSINKEKYSGVAINFEFTDSLATHFIEVFSNNTPVYKQKVTAKQVSITKELIPPGEYEIRIFKDLNGNSFCDEGDYFQKILPETKFYHKEKFLLRENWDISNYTIKF